MSLTTEFIITLLKTPKLGQVSVRYISESIKHKVSNINELFDSIVELKMINAKIPIPQRDALAIALGNAQQIMEVAERKNINILTSEDKHYPHRLKRLDDFPPVIYYKGSLSAINAERSVAVIGTREPSSFGVKAGRRIAGIFAEHGFSIISGLAVGCDSAGHLGALDAGGQTVGVLANGVDIIYPKENTALAERILEADGALLSEYEPGAKAFRQSFVQRDRIQSGLSDGLIVLETDIKGGTMHTVGFAGKINIPIACLAGHPDHLRDHPKTKGTQYLINNGAFPLANQNQINSYLQVLSPDVVITKAEQEEGFKIKADQIELSQADNQKTLEPEINEINADPISSETIISLVPVDSKESPNLNNLKSINDKRELRDHSIENQGLTIIEELTSELHDIKLRLQKLEEIHKETQKLLSQLLNPPVKEKIKKNEDKQKKLL